MLYSETVLLASTKCLNECIICSDRFGDGIQPAFPVANEQRIQLAQDLIYEKTGMQIDIKKTHIVDLNTYLNTERSSCSMCANTSHSLKLAGISPSEWHDYLEQRIR